MVPNQPPGYLCVMSPADPAPAPLLIEKPLPVAFRSAVVMGLCLRGVGLNYWGFCARR